MPLTAGTRLGSYEIVTILGAGGMGEVYRARDTRLERAVALKMLPPAFVGDPERLARFEREARTLASLNHPHIAQIYGLEESNGVRFLVMELVKGETLAARVARGPVHVDEALVIASQIAAAVEAAHERGVIHRDLKPANVALTETEQVKVLDFGLAKANGSTAEPPFSPSALANSPTITSPAMTTGAGVILGTAAYMSPEQARGKAVDQRADVWAFGCVLFEMLTARPAFGGETVTDVIAGVIHDDPPWDALPRNTPVRVRRVLRRCLTKDPARRLRDIGDARLDLDDAPADGNDVAAPQPAPAGSAVWRTVAAFAGGVAIAGAVGWATSTRRPNARAPVARWTVSLPADATLDVSGPWASMALSRDGRSLAYVAATSTGRELYLRRSDDLTPHPVGGTAGVWEAFFSPDGQWIGFIASDRLKKVAVTGGQPVLVADVANFNSGVWGDDGTIYVGGRAGLAKIAPDGKLTSIVTPQPNESELYQPDLLPDGSLLFTIKPNDVTSFDDARIAVVTPKGARRVVLEGGASARYSPSGHIVYVRGGQIMAAPFDISRIALSGPPAPVVSGGSFDAAAGAAFFALSRTGVFAYAPGGPLVKTRQLGWLDRRGALTPIPAPPRFYAEPAVSPDGRQIALTIRAANDDIWTYDIARATFTRLTFPHGNNDVPIWSPDGSRIVYAIEREGVRSLFSRPADGGGAEAPLTPAEFYQTPGSWSPDGKWFAYQQDRPDTASDILVLPIDGNGKPIPFLATPVNERSPVFSPDGHWIAYLSDETGRFEVFVAPYPGPGRRRQISDGGGVVPKWRRDGREIVYVNGNRLMSVAVSNQSPPEFDRPRELVPLPPHTGYVSTTPTGDRFVVVYSEAGDAIVRELHVVVNWFDDLRTRVPTP